MNVIQHPELQRYHEYAQSLPMQPVQVRCYTAKPIAGQENPHLDGVLANAVCQSLQLGWINVPHDSVLFVPTPLRVEEWIDGLPLWSCNDFTAVNSHVRYTRYCQKSGDNPTTQPAQMATLGRKKPMRLPATINGQYQHYLLPLRTEFADYWEGTCYGNLNEIKRLLEPISQIGKKRKVGWGSVLKWEIEPTDNFVLTRPKPADSGVFRSWTNPHWDSRLWRYCA